MSKGTHKRMQRRLKERRHLAKVEERIKYETTDMLMLMPLYVLHEHFGFGQRRSQRFLIEFQRIFTAIANGDVRTETLAACVDNDIGLRYDMDAGVWEVTRNMDRGRRKKFKAVME